MFVTHVILFRAPNLIHSKSVTVTFDMKDDRDFVISQDMNKIKRGIRFIMTYNYRCGGEHFAMKPTLQTILFFDSFF